jgi:hypothetical protein
MGPEVGTFYHFRYDPDDPTTSKRLAFFVFATAVDIFGLPHPVVFQLQRMGNHLYLAHSSTDTSRLSAVKCLLYLKTPS